MTNPITQLQFMAQAKIQHAETEMAAACRAGDDPVGRAWRRQAFRQMMDAVAYGQEVGITPPKKGLA